MRGKAVLAVLAVLVCGAPWPARAHLTDAVNWARSAGCAAPRASGLHNVDKLTGAAQRVANGASAQAALASVGYAAREVSVVHLSGAAGDESVGRVLASRYCRALTEPTVLDMGAQRRGRDVWIVLAVPATLPPLGDTMTIGDQIMAAVNRARRVGHRCGDRVYPAAAPLVQNAALRAAALAHSQDMASHEEFDHRGHDGSSPSVRVERAGYGAHQLIGENIAAGAMTPAEVAQGWLDSPAHCENIMDSRFSEFGFGFAVNPSSSEQVYWTEEFAAPRK